MRVPFNYIIWKYLIKLFLSIFLTLLFLFYLNLYPKDLWLDANYAVVFRSLDIFP